MKVGIEDAASYVPCIYLPIEAFANARGIEYPKLRKGLGLEKMALPDMGEDAATMAANALIKLFEQGDLNPKEIGRIYLGTESALDGAKPTATYAVEMLEMFLEEKHGPNCLEHADVTDMTFACIGAIDALQNTIDWVKAGKNRKGIVIASDFAKYDLNSSGEYTQGAGAVALLIQENPSMVVFDDEWAVSTKSVHDFFKPRRRHLFNELPSAEKLSKALKTEEPFFEEFKETPVFDGQFSNTCYQDRMVSAYQTYQKINDKKLSDWDAMVFHLPYAYHGRRIFTPLFIDAHIENGTIERLETEVGLSKDDAGFERAVSKSATYKTFVSEQIANGEILSTKMGNLYTASIFMAFMSLFTHAADNLVNKRIGFIAYGSGSKSKVFSVKVQETYKEKVASWSLLADVESRSEITFSEYERLHKNLLKKPLRATKSYFLLDTEEKEHALEGQRFYKANF